EAEWEYAARAGNSNCDEILWSGTSDNSNLNDFSWNYSNTNGATSQRTKTLKPNKWGLYDMSGNVQEFCWDLYNANQYTSNRKGIENPSGAAAGTYRVVRGGCVANYSSEFCSVTSRWYQMPDECNEQTGFRVVRLAKEDKDFLEPDNTTVFYGIAKINSLNVSDSTIISVPSPEKTISVWEENILIESKISEKGKINTVTVNPFVIGGRLSVPEFSVQLYEHNGDYYLQNKSAQLAATPIFLDSQNSTNGEADEKTNESLNFIVDKFTLNLNDEAFTASFRMNFIGQNPHAKKGRASDTRSEMNYLALLVTVTGSTNSNSLKLSNKTTWEVETPLTVSGSVTSSPTLKYEIFQNDSNFIVKMNAFSYSPKMRIGDIYISGSINENGAVTSSASKNEPKIVFTINDEKVLPIKINSFEGVFNQTWKHLSFSFIPGSMPLSISVTLNDFKEVRD
ncbi:MAG: formylglycine-generating enzyme family protein, partial [Treponema sp.]|nr:formylglycine-generating enzyme family protein [Treponema sp.]